MVRARCPFCGVQNDVGLLEPVNPGDPTPMMRTCDHFVYASPTKYQGAQYVVEELRVDADAVDISYGLDAELLRILNGYFKFVGQVAFAPNEEAREGARAAVEDFLRARKRT